MSTSGTGRGTDTATAADDASDRPDATGGSDDEAASRDRGTRDRWVLAGLVVLAVVPFVALVVTRAGRPYLPVQDFAVNDLRVRDVFSSDVPLVGPYSRYGWSHPGPLVLWLVAPLSRLFGGAAWATQAGFALLQAVAAGWTVVLAWRHKGSGAAALWLAVLALTALAVGPTGLLEAWGPNVALPFFVLFCCQVWLVTPTTLRPFPQAVVVGTLLVQTHVGYAPLVLAGGVLLVVAVRRAAGSWRGVLGLRPVRWAVGLGLGLWLPALLDTALHPPGNLARVVRDTVLRSSEPKAGLGAGLGLLAGAFRPLPGWLGGQAPYDELTQTATRAGIAWLLVPLVVLAAAAFVARRRCDTDGLRLVLVAAVMLAAGVVALASVQGATFPYLFFWRDALGALTLAAGLAVGVRALAARWPVAGTLGTATAMVVAAVAVVALTAELVTTPTVFDRFGEPTQDLVDQLAGATPGGPVLVRTGGTPLGGVEGGVIDELARRGVDVRVDPERSFQFGRGRSGTPSQVSSIWYVAEESDQVSLLSARPGARVLARHRVLDDGGRARLTELQRDLADRLSAAGRDDLVPRLASPLVAFALDGVPGIDHGDLDELGRLNQAVEAGTCECAVIALPPSADAPAP